jgi:nickel transport protein
MLGGALFGLTVVGTPSALALPDSDVQSTLRTVPVFTITDESGSPLVADINEDDPSGAAVAGIFITYDDAQNFMNNLQQNNPDLAQEVQVVPVSLAEVYTLALTSQQQQSPIEFVFVPSEQEVESAISLLQEDDTTVDGFEGVPLFIPRSTAGEGGYLTVPDGDNQVIPMFFEREAADALISRVQASQPSLAESLDVQVINLEGLIDTLQSSDNPELTQILLVPPRASLEYIQSLQQNPGQPAQELPAQTQPEQPSAADQLNPEQ